MTRITEVKRQLEEVREAIEVLDADFAAGRLGPEEHGRQRAEREREAGRLFVSLRRAQRDARARQGEEPAAAAGPWRHWVRSPLAIASVAVLLVAVGIGAGVAVGRRYTEAPAFRPAGGAPSLAPGGAPSAILPELEREALRQAVAREDAPTPSVLQFAHVALDQGRLDEARRAYARVLAREPENVEAITHLGAALFQEGRLDEALAKVEEALRIDPRYIHAHWDRTQYLFHGKRDFPAAVKAAEAFLDVTAEGQDADTVRKLLAEARQRAGQRKP